MYFLVLARNGVKSKFKKTHKNKILSIPHISYKNQSDNPKATVINNLTKKLKYSSLIKKIFFS
ncbi:TPA: hypothetical protein DEG21_05665 [Patescibacteria group bacterium]|nr:hypothetical protein [Candidatus Gracilibacteria bacterium]HBY75306.1 hypothetical protein [Candidatus Gracilibacteria bacterium]